MGCASLDRSVVMIPFRCQRLCGYDDTAGGNFQGIHSLFTTRTFCGLERIFKT